ncbi:MAG: N-acetylglucosamine-6-phosphate deacetylase [Lachnospiraceae bacterium]|nr:N-acetylglucosamine-6-phosphate deacetylase [Lachnospiraceae bacterium]
MITRLKSDKLIVGEALFSGYVYFEDRGVITAVTSAVLPYDVEYDYTGYYVAPGFIDIHAHGGAGYEFLGSAEDIVQAANFHLSHGTTSICPTISAAPFEVMEKSVVEVKKAMADITLEPNIIGLHLEGPYLSAEQCGAQCPDFITAPIPEQYEKLINEAGNVIARWTYAPENDVNGRFCKYLTEHGIVASAGHTNATYEDMQWATENGCGLVTHLYSCTSTVTRKFGFRKLGVIESAYMNDDLYVEIIADGRHLPPELIRLILKIKGKDRIVLCTDSLALTGTNVTEGVTLNTAFIIEDGVCKLRDRSAFAGSIATSDCLIRVMTREVGVDMATAVKMITKVPAEILGLNKGTLEAGKDADIVVFDNDVKIREVFVCGNKCRW